MEFDSLVCDIQDVPKTLTTALLLKYCTYICIINYKITLKKLNFMKPIKISIGFKCEEIKILSLYMGPHGKKKSLMCKMYTIRFESSAYNSSSFRRKLLKGATFIKWKSGSTPFSTEKSRLDRSYISHSTMSELRSFINTK